MTEMNFAEIQEVVDYYEHDSALRELHNRARQYWHPLFAMTHVPQLPDHLTRGISVSMPSPRLRDLTDGLVADMASYRSIVTVSPISERPPSGDLKDQADKVEKALSVMRAGWNDGGRFRAKMLREQLVGPYFVAILSCGDLTESEDNPWTVLTPDPLSCYFPVSGSPDRPKLMARRYKQLVRDVEARYSGRPRTAKHDAKLSYNGGKWHWEALGRDTNIQQSYDSRPGGNPKYGEECEFLWLDDGEYIYHVALDKNTEDRKASGEVVWCGKNLVGGCSALVVCGSPTHLREVKQMLGPAALPIMQTTLNINLIRSIRAAGALNAKPDVMVETTPEAFQVMRDNGLLEQVQLDEGVPNILHVEGKPVPWVVNPNLDLDKLDEAWREEQAEYIGEWREPSDPKTVQDATANAYLLAVEAIRRRQTPLLKDGDWLETQLCKMVLHSIKHEYKREFTLHTSESVPMARGEVKGGMAVKIGPSDLDFEYDVNVATRAQTESEQRAREEHGVWRRDQGIDTQEHIIETGFIDATEQFKALAIDAGLRIEQPALKVAIYSAWRDIVKTEAGILLPPTEQDLLALGQPQGDASGMGGVPPMVPPAVGGPVGGA